MPDGSDTPALGVDEATFRKRLKAQAKAVPKKRLTPRQAKFARKYAETGIGAEAAREAGYSDEPGCAKTIAHRLLTKVDVSEEVTRWRLRLEEKQDITAERVINTIAHIGEEAVVQGQFGPALKAQDMLANHLGLYAPSVSVHVNAGAAHLAALLAVAERRKVIDITPSQDSDLS